ncbi:MAG: S-layer homology domain-containing protein [Clostridiales bacterium]|nr:S-layer homology domain-containing protein [Clostridiales bacterium]
MERFKKQGLSLLLAVVLLLGLTVNASAAVSPDTLASAVTDTAQYIYKTVKAPQVGSIGGEWAVMALARSGYDVPEEYYRNYYATVEAYVEACGGVLHEKKYTEYSRVIVALSAIGKDARNVAGYDLTKALGDYDKTIWQGLNGPIWALIALDSSNYPMPQNPEAKTQATRQMYIDRILDCQLPDGGWSLFGGTAAASAGDGVSDPDITGMALQALAKYQDQPAVKQATEEALTCMSKQQDSSGGFSSWGVANSESCVQMIVALCELGIPLDDPRFVKNGNTMLDNLMTFYLPGNGFQHTESGSGSNQMASEQGFYGLVSAQRAAMGKNSLYRMGDAITVTGGDGQQSGQGLAGKHDDVKVQPIIEPGKTFEDISGVNAHTNQMAIEALAARGIIDGKGGGLFDPDATMTRAEFATIVVRALGLPLKATDNFTDVKSADWYAEYVGTAYTYGIVNGTTDTTFTPNGTITRQEAAVMVARAAKLCGMDTALDNAAIRDTLAQFGDYVTADEWARESLAFCYGEGILDDSEFDILPKLAIKRCEIAQMIFHLLGRADLI